MKKNVIPARLLDIGVALCPPLGWRKAWLAGKPKMMSKSYDCFRLARAGCYLCSHSSPSCRHTTIAQSVVRIPRQWKVRYGPRERCVAVRSMGEWTSFSSLAETVGLRAKLCGSKGVLGSLKRCTSSIVLPNSFDFKRLIPGDYAQPPPMLRSSPAI